MGLLLTPAQRKRNQFISSRRIWTDLHHLILNDMEDCKELAKDWVEPPCAVVAGETGSGKSTTIDEFRNNHKHYEESDRSVKPVIYCVLPTKLSERGLLLKLLKAIGQEIEDYKDLDENDLLELIVEYVDKLGIELFIIDEAQGFLDRENRKLIYDATECLKNLIIATKTPFILFGLPWCLDAIEMNSQLASRCFRRRRLLPFKITEPKDRAVYLDFLDMLDEEFGFEEKADLKSQQIALRLFVVSRGNLRVLRSIIDQAATFAIEDDAHKISYEHFRRGCEVLFPGEENPFSIEDLEQIKYVELAKPSYWDSEAKKGENPIVEQSFTEARSISDFF